MEWVQAFVLGLLQGLTEFLPVSSSAHLRVLPELLGWGDPGAAFTAIIQIGTELAVLVYFARDIGRIVAAWARSLTRPERRGELDARLGWYVIVGSLPVVILGVLLKDPIEQAFRSLWVVGTTLVLLGVVLGIADQVGARNRGQDELRMRDAVVCGLVQSLALVPGVSRSGATISAGLFLGLERAVATRFAFLLAIPAVVGAGLFELRNVVSGRSVNAYATGPTVLATVVSFVVGYAAIAWLLRYVSSHSYLPFVVYRVVLGCTVLGLLATGVLTP